MYSRLFPLNIASTLYLHDQFVNPFFNPNFKYNVAFPNILYKNQMRLISLLLLLVTTLHFDPSSPMQNLCPSQHNRKYVDISSAKIERSSTFEYSLELFNSPITIHRNGSEILFRGNFSRLILKNHALRKHFEYFGREMILKIPADHVFSMQKIPDLEIQIIHVATEDDRTNAFKYVMFSQLYMVSTFTSKIQTELKRYFSPQVKDGDVVETAKIVKVIKGFPILMYKGSAESFPCRSDLLCLLKREYQLIAQDDFQTVRSVLFEDGQLLPKTKSIKRKNLYEIQQITKREGTVEVEQL